LDCTPQVADSNPSQELEIFKIYPAFLAANGGQTDGLHER
jgi:hypothetical protein